MYDVLVLWPAGIYWGNSAEMEESAIQDAFYIVVYTYY